MNHSTDDISDNPPLCETTCHIGWDWSGRGASLISLRQHGSQAAESSQKRRRAESILDSTPGTHRSSPPAEVVMILTKCVLHSRMYNCDGVCRSGQ